MTKVAKLPKDFKLFQIRVFDVCAGCDGSGKKPYHPLEACPICRGSKIVATVLHEGATLDILMAKIFESGSKKRINELLETPLPKERIGEIEVTSEYWDCDCPGFYIHPKTDACCEICSAVREECPDS